jgi:hypothetical protein
MNNMLEAKIRMLEKIIEEQKAYIETLEKDLKARQALPNLGTINIPSAWTVPSQDTCEHDYNYAWNATTPQPCKKCGKPINTYTVTYSNSVKDSVLVIDGSNLSKIYNIGLEPLPKVTVDPLKVY